MCIICVEFQSKRLSLTEAKRNLGEMISTLDAEHAAKVQLMLADAEAEQGRQDD